MPTPLRCFRAFWLFLAFVGLSQSAVFSQGGTITANGQTVTGTLSGVSGTYDTWNYTLPRNGGSTYYSCVSVNSTSGTSVSLKGSPSEFYSYARLCPAPATAYVVGQPGSYALTLEYGGPGPIIPSASGGPALPGMTYSGSVVGNKPDIWTFPLKGGDPFSITYTTSGLRPEMYLIAPSGSGLAYTTTSGPNTITISGKIAGHAALGTYKLLTSLYDSTDSNVAYTLTFNGPNLPTDGKSDGSFCLACSLGGAAAGDPINVSQGNLFEPVSDYSTAGLNPLSFTRYYNSASKQRNPAATFLGVNWRSNYDRYLRILSTTQATAERADGRIINFYNVSGTWAPDTDVDVELAQSGNLWTLTDSDDTVESYTVASGLGILNSIKARNGYTQRLSYSGAQLTTVTDSYNRSLAFTYASGTISTLTTPDSLILTYGYTNAASLRLLNSVSYDTNPETIKTYLYENTSLPFLLTGIMDELGHRYATWTYDAYGRGISSKQGDALAANYTQISYDDGTGNRTVTGPLGIQETYKFAMLQGIPKVNEIDRHDPSGSVPDAVYRYAYDANGYVHGTLDWRGIENDYILDAHGQPTTIYEANVSGTPTRTTTIAYDATWIHQPATITTSGLTTAYTYQTGTGNVLTKTLTDTMASAGTYAAATRVWTYGYAAIGNGNGLQLLTSIRNPRTDLTMAARTTTFGYESNGFLKSVTNGLGQATTITAHTGGFRPTSTTDPNGVMTAQTYDGRLNLQTSTIATAAGKLTTTYSHDAANNLTGVQQPDGSKLIYGYDAAHRLTSTTDRLGNRTVSTLDASGDATLVDFENAAGTVTRKHFANFDALGRKMKDIGGVGQTTAYTYDADGNMLTLTPPAPSGMVSYSYDALNRRATAKDPAPGGTTTTTYDDHDRLLSVKDANGHTTSYTYDGFGDRIRTVSPDSGTTIYRYDAGGNQTQIVRPGPQTQDTSFDALDRPLATTFPSDATLNISRSYDQTGHGFGTGRLTSATDQAGTLGLIYDERGNATQEIRAVTGAGTLKMVTAYDAASRVAGIKYPSGTTVVYGRDSMGRVTSVLAGAPGAPTSSTVVSGVTYEPFGSETTLAFGNGIKGTYAYDLDYRPLSRTETGAAAVQKLGYTYFANDSLNTITDGVDSRNSQTFGYDALDRLTKASSGAGGYGAQTFSWDPVGNISSRVLGGISTTFSYAPGSNRLAQAKDAGSDPELVASTPAGNLTGISVDGAAMETATYNQANQLASAVTMTMGAYSYDLFGQRLKKALPGQYPLLYQFSRNGGQLLSENDLHGGQAADYIYLNGRPIGEIDPKTGKLYFTHTDRLGTPQKLTDSAQKLAWSALYQPFGSTGTVNATITQSLRLPGQQFDPESGLNHNGFRDYSPDLGRYIESDPIGLAGGLNTYAYVGNNPMRFTDLRGLQGSPFGDGPINPYIQQQQEPQNSGGLSLTRLGFDLGEVVQGGFELSAGAGALVGTGGLALPAGLFGIDQGLADLKNGITHYENDIHCRAHDLNESPTPLSMMGDALSRVTGMPELQGLPNDVDTLRGFLGNAVDKTFSVFNMLDSAYSPDGTASNETSKP